MIKNFQVGSYVSNSIVSIKKTNCYLKYLNYSAVSPALTPDKR